MPIVHNSQLADREPSWGSVKKSQLPPSAFSVVEDPQVKSTWHAPHHFVRNDTMYLHRGGLIAAKAAVQGARTGKIPSWRAKAVPHLNRHLAAIGLNRIEMAWSVDTATAIMGAIENEELTDERAVDIVRFYVSRQEPVYVAASRTDEELLVDWTRFTEGWQRAVDVNGAGCKCTQTLFQTAIEVYEEAWLRQREARFTGPLADIISAMPGFDTPPPTFEGSEGDEQEEVIPESLNPPKEDNAAPIPIWHGAIPPYYITNITTNTPDTTSPTTTTYKLNLLPVVEKVESG